MKKSVQVIISVFALVLAINTSASQLFVDPVRGDDGNDGKTAITAFKTIQKARDTVRTLNKDMKSDVIVHLRGGRYQLNETLFFDYQDSGSDGHAVVYRAYEKEEPIICGGRKVTGWKPVEGKPYFVAPVPERKAVKRKSPFKDNRTLPLHPRFYSCQKLSDEGFAAYFSQLYVNGVRAERARTSNVLTSSREEWWDNPETKAFYDGIYVNKSEMQNYTNPEDVRLLYLEEFKTLDAPLEAILPCDEDEMILKMKQPAFVKGSSWERFQPSSQFFIINALEELDEPGEWYLDQKKDVVYYYPRKVDGDLNKAEVYAPRVECLVKVDGTVMRRVKNMRFEGITFQHGNWTDPKDNYLGLSQAEIYKTYTSEFPGQVIVNYADNVSIVRCTVRHMGSCGIQFYEGCKNSLIEGNVTYDTTGAGITIGRWWFHKFECPPSSICVDTMVRNNVVRNTGRDYWQGTGLNIFVAYDCKVHHNDISDTAYTALHARAGGSEDGRVYIHPQIGKIEYKWNKVSRGFAGHKWGIGDGGHIYMHGRLPNSIITENYSLYANRSVNMEYYPDNDTIKSVWTNNVSRYSKAKNSFYKKAQSTVHHNYSDNRVTAGVQHHTLVKDENWPAEAIAIMDKAGLQPEYRDLLKSIYGHENLAQGKTCWASSELNDTASAKAGCDDNWETMWHTSDGGDGQAWWAVDLGAAHVIQRITILPRQDLYEAHVRSNLEVQASNDREFKTYDVLAERNDIPWYHKKPSATSHTRASNMWEQFLNVDGSYRYLRVKANNTNGDLNFAEFSAYGYRK